MLLRGVSKDLQFIFDATTLKGRSRIGSHLTRYYMEELLNRHSDKTYATKGGARRVTGEPRFGKSFELDIKKTGGNKNQAGHAQDCRIDRNVAPVAFTLTILQKVIFMTTTHFRNEDTAECKTFEDTCPDMLPATIKF